MPFSFVKLKSMSPNHENTNFLADFSTDGLKS